jgi:formylglycine-generating enzyme required for sulfatase activity
MSEEVLTSKAAGSGGNIKFWSLGLVALMNVFMLAAIWLASSGMINESGFSMPLIIGLIVAVVATMIIAVKVLGIFSRLSLLEVQIVVFASMVLTASFAIAGMVAFKLSGIEFSNNVGLLLFCGEALIFVFLLMTLFIHWLSDAQTAQHKEAETNIWQTAPAAHQFTQNAPVRDSTPDSRTTTASTEALEPTLGQDTQFTEVPADESLDQLIELVRKEEQQKREQELLREAREIQLKTEQKQQRVRFVADYAKYLQVIDNTYSSPAIRQQAWKHIIQKYQVESPDSNPGELIWTGGKVKCSSSLKTGDTTQLMLSNRVWLDLVWIAPGEFTMGSPETRIGFLGALGLSSNQLHEGENGRCEDEGPQTKVTLSKGYWIGKYPVTQAQWQVLMGDNPSSFKTENDQHPVENITWTDAMLFCQKVYELEGKSGSLLPAGYEYTLPTEAQWEFACRAGTTTRFYTGNSDADLDAAGWFSGNHNHTTRPVGLKAPNAWGLHDMHGNVYEWCADWYADSYSGGEVVDPHGPAWSTYRIVRGGSWHLDARFCRSANRGRCVPCGRNYDLGFRLALRSSE